MDSDQQKEEKEEQDSFLSSGDKLTRRQAISTMGKAAIGVVAAAAIGGAVYYGYQSQSNPGPTTTTTTQAKAALLGLIPGPYIFPESIARWKQENGGQDIQNTTLDLANEAAVVTGSSGKGWDATIVSPVTIIENSGAVQPVLASKIPRWDKNKISDLFVNPEKYLGPKDGGDLRKSIYPPNKPDYLWGTVPLFNWDSIGYLPEFLPFQEQGGQKTISYGDTVDHEWKGVAANQDFAVDDFGEAGNYLEKTNQITLEGTAGNMTHGDIDKVTEWYMPIMQSGHYRTIWGTFGDGVNILSTKEVHITSTWQPVIMEVRRAGTPAYYAFMQQGLFFWYNMAFVASQAPHVDDATKYLNFLEEAWWTAFITRNGYTVPTYTYDDVKTIMGPEFYGWMYNGQATFRPVGQIISKLFPDKASLPARLQNALFLPDRYGAEMGWLSTGAPDSNGNLRDHGSVVDRINNAPWWGGGNNVVTFDYYQQQWERLKAARPSG